MNKYGFIFALALIALVGVGMVIVNNAHVDHIKSTILAEKWCIDNGYVYAGESSLIIYDNTVKYCRDTTNQHLIPVPYK